MAINVSDLPPKYQQQVLQQLGKTARETKSKLRNQPTERAGIRFDSKKEADRFSELQTLEQAGIIRGLKLQADYTLQEAYTTPQGERIRAIRYKADFDYYERQEDGSFAHVVEDVKGFRTDKYRLKRKLMQERFGISIRET